MRNAASSVGPRNQWLRCCRALSAGAASVSTGIVSGCSNRRAGCPSVGLQGGRRRGFLGLARVRAYTTRRWA